MASQYDSDTDDEFELSGLFEYEEDSDTFFTDDDMMGYEIENYPNPEDWAEI